MRAGAGISRSVPVEQEPAFAEGEVLAGRYRIVRFLNRGGMGEVYEAEDLEFHERIALKTLLPEIASDARMIARFKQEIQLSRRIANPHVCRELSAGVRKSEAVALCHPIMPVGAGFGGRVVWINSLPGHQQQNEKHFDKGHNLNQSTNARFVTKHAPALRPTRTKFAPMPW